MLLFVSITQWNCRAVEKNSGSDTIPEALIKSKLGEKYAVSYNRSKTFALCQQQNMNDHSQRKFKYVVIQLSDKKIVHEGTYQLGYVQWHGDNAIEVLNSSSSARDDTAGDKKIITINQHQR